PRDPVEQLDPLVRVVAARGRHAVAQLPARAGREELCDRQDAERQHHQRDHQLDQRRAVLAKVGPKVWMRHEGPHRVSTNPDIWMLTVSRAPRRFCRMTSPEALARPSLSMVGLTPTE